MVMSKYGKIRHSLPGVTSKHDMILLQFQTIKAHSCLLPRGVGNDCAMNSPAMGNNHGMMLLCLGNRCDIV